MIKIENTSVFGWEAAIRGARNPMNSWHMSDSTQLWTNEPWIGPNDHRLLSLLAKAGNDHGKFMRMINVTLDINAPLYWWKEFDTYKVGTTANSCSTMHKIHAKEFELDDFSHEHLFGEADQRDVDETIGILNIVVDMLNACRNEYLASNDKYWWWQMIQLLPSSYNQRRTVQLNYAVLKAMYHARKHHKLDEWREFCQWIESLPYSELITEVERDG